MNRRYFLASIVALPVVAKALTAGEPDLYIPPGAKLVYLTNLTDKPMTLKHSWCKDFHSGCMRKGPHGHVRRA